MVFKISEKPLHNLLLALVKHIFLNEEGILESIRESILEKKTVEESVLEELCAVATTVLKKAACENLEPEELVKLVQETNSFSEDHLPIFERIWKSNKDKVHAALCEQAGFSSQFHEFNWRIDVPAASRDNPGSVATEGEGEQELELAPRAHLQIVYKPKNKVSSAQAEPEELETIFLELNRESVKDFAAQLRLIEETIQSKN
eukprot:GCRY01001764.1.p1 GENE.GCRY01001764.1~~GCRY01001764.1.p1  ORF type:complete len:203 (-),score=33.03 GCRY01001764.1:19-627(-)